MKVAVLADTHFGVRGDDPNLRENQCRFIRETFLPTVRERGITTAIHLGDLFDRRKYVNYVTARACWDTLVSPLNEMGVDTTYIIGNHDCYYRNTNSLNSIQTLYGGHVKVAVDPMMIDLDGRTALLAPWICDDNRERSMKLFSMRPDIILGHLELVGFEMQRGQLCDHGTDPLSVADARVVLSGHFHTRSRRNNVHYIGATAQYTWADFGEPKGFAILDTETFEVEYIDNPHTAFTKLVYDDAEGEEKVMAKVAEATVQGRYVKLVVNAKKDPFLLERVIDKVEAAGVVDLQVIDGSGNDAEFDPTSVHIVDETDTLKVLTEMVADAQSKEIIKELYVKAQMRL